MSAKPIRLLYSLVMFVVVSALAGVLIAGLFLPVAGIAGLSSRAVATEMKAIPAEMDVSAQPQRSKILLSDGSVLAYVYDQNRVYVALRDIAPVMRQAQLAIEDHRFYQHGAMDFRGTLRALIRNSTSSNGTQGGSSITQQYVKMVQVEKARQVGDAAGIKAAQETTYARKIQELRYAIALEDELSKDEILERYLNIAYFGQGNYGVEAAARYYFNTSAKNLELAEAAMLAGLVQNPDTNNPVSDRAAALERRDVVLNRMAELTMITAGQLKAAKKSKFSVRKIQPMHNGCVGSEFPFLCQYVIKTLEKTPSLGKTVEDRMNLLLRGGLTVETKVDRETQRRAQKAVSAVVDPRDPVISTMNMIEPGTGQIIAMAQSRPEMGSNLKKGQTYWNYSAEPSMGGIQGYQAGSTFKAFTAAAALEKGIPLTKKFNARQTMNFSGKRFRSCEGKRRVWGAWNVSNSTGTSGVMNMYRGTEKSVNTYFVQLEFAAGMCRVTKMAEKLGVKSSAEDRPLVDFYQNKPAFTLGSVEVSPLSVAEAYATFAARGIHCNPVIVAKITTRQAISLPIHDAQCKRVISEDVADGMNKLLSSVMTKGTGKRAIISDGRPQAGKTGTIDSNEAVWFAGYTPDVVGVAMISIDNQKKPFRKGSAGFRSRGVKNYLLPRSKTLLEGTGSGDAGMKIWKPTMDSYLKGTKKTPFQDPPKELTTGRSVTIPGLAGLGDWKGRQNRRDREDGPQKNQDGDD
ncbi:MAG: Multimodular transpeptidase-transglycosylase [uncultured Propionibacteriaceae bacterium]|uniref:Multimodular transpeptidase-transglycosylase n=1 Tax=uncultured Propionibacteriaceae bacterium TaxID=257457 RepID=A0A6J4PAS3_9ACTN|nr:MAG: Multimodular transpeptidase-transglycosylase [uncultured Propionibacteriaceae bacterium]